LPTSPYIANIHPRNIALETWRGVKVIGRCGFVANPDGGGDARSDVCAAE